MSLWSRIVDAFAKDTTSDAPAQWLIDWTRGGQATVSGERVSPSTAMHTSAVYACVNVRSEDVGKLPCIMYQRLADGGKRRAVEHPLYSIVRDRPNPRMTALEFRQMMQAHKDLRGNAYALKEFDARGQVVALWPLVPDWVTVLQARDDYELFYRIACPGKEIVTIPAAGIVHLRGLSLDGIIGLSPISYHRETIGVAIAAEKYGAAFFGNGAQPMGALKVPTVLQPEATKALRESWEAQFKGARNAKKMAIFDGGMEWMQTGMTNVDSQYLDVMKFQNQQIYGMYRMPAHKVGDLERSTNNNIEQQALEYVTDCLMTQLVSFEQTLKLSLLSAEEISAGFFFEFLPDALLRGDLKSRYEAYAIGRNWGWLSVNDICDRENMNHVPNGDIRLQPMNMQEAGAKAPPVSAPAPGGAKYILAMAKQLVAAEEAREQEALRIPHLNGHGSGAPS